MPDVTPELEQAKARAEERLLGLPGVTGVDIGFKEVGGEPTDELAIRVLVAEKKPLEEVPGEERIPEVIEGHPSDVIQRRFELHSTGAYAPADEVLSAIDAGTYSPVRGGVSVGPCRAIGGFVHAGTLGAIVVDNASRRYFALSNFHVLAVDGAAADGDTMVQPSRVDGGVCPAQVAGQLRRRALTPAVDAAVMDLGQAARPEVVEVGAVTGTGTATLGQPVRKRGRTTRLTYGVVDSVSLTLNVDYGHDIGVRTLTGQIGVRPDPARSPKFSAKGDSGSVLVGEAREVVGLLFAGDDTGYGVANPIAEVLSALDISVATGPAGKRVEVFSSSKIEPEFKDRFGGKERKSDKTEFKDDKDQKNEAKEDKDLKNEVKEDKDAKDERKESKDKSEKDEAKESKDELKEKQEKDEAKEKQEKDELKEKSEKDELKEKSEKDEFKETKDEPKEIKEKQEKPERKEGKDEAKEAKNEGKENKDLSDKDLQDHKEPEFLPRSAQASTRPTGGKDQAALRKELKEVKQEYKEFKQEFKDTKDYKDKAEKDELKEGKDEAKEVKNEGKETKDYKDKTEKVEGKETKIEQKDTKDFQPDAKNNKLEGKDIKSEKPEQKDIEVKDPKQEIKDRIEKPVKEWDIPDPNQLRLPVERRIAALETAITRLNHFIGRAMRPDLSQGALHQEPDAAAQDDQ